MKHLITILFFLQSFYVFSQVPQRINFQAILRNSNGSLLSNTQVGIQISIVQGTASGPTVYTERFTPSTNGNGLVTLEIGGGTMISGNFANINWANGPFYIKSETDPNGGTNYSLVSTTALLSIPYALYAKTAEKVTNLNLSELDDVQINNPVSGQVLKWNGTSWTPATDNTGGGSTSGDDWGNQTAVSSSPLTGTGTTSSPLTISNNSITTNHIQDQSILPADFSEVNVTQNEVFAFQNGQWQTQHLRELGGIIGTGIAGTIPKFSDVSTLTNSIISESTIGLTIDGNVGIGAGPLLTKKFRVVGDVDVSGDLYLGSAEYFSDGGPLTIQTNSSLVPESDNSRPLGRSSDRWTAVWAADGTINTSDARLKKDITKIKPSLAKVMLLNPVTFLWQKNRLDQKQELGFLAQELLEVVPESVVTHEVKNNADGSEELVPVENLGVKYHTLIPVLTKAIQEQQTMIQAQQALLDSLRKEIDLLKIEKK